MFEHHIGTLGEAYLSVTTFEAYACVDLVCGIWEVLQHKGGLIVRSRSNRYGLPERMNLLRGRFIGNAKGFGFVAPEVEGMDDIFIPPYEINGALNGDTVLVRVMKESSGDRREGAITKVVERSKTTFVGTYQANKGFGFVVTDDKKLNMDIFIAKEDPLFERIQGDGNWGVGGACPAACWAD